jgi:hypothetical protein
VSGEVYTRFCWGSLRKRDNLEDLGIREMIILKWFFKTWDREAWTGLIELKIAAGGVRL